MRPSTASLGLLAAATLFAGTTSAETPAERSLPSFEGRPIVRPAPAPRFEIVGDSSLPLPVFASSDGHRFVLGVLGERYRIHVVNPTPARLEAVISVDGLDAIDGQPASLAKRGYVIPAFGDVVIDGWRTSLDAVAAFRFASVDDSYAARTGHDRNVGVIGVAVFRQQPPPPPPMAWHSLPGSTVRGGADGRGAPAPSSARRSESKSAAGLGTQFGESHDSRVVETAFTRATPTSPMQLGEVRYDDREGLLARGIALPALRDGRWADLQRRDSAQPFADARFAQPPRRR